MEKRQGGERNEERTVAANRSQGAFRQVCTEGSKSECEQGVGLAETKYRNHNNKGRPQRHAGHRDEQRADARPLTGAQRAASFKGGARTAAIPVPTPPERPAPNRAAAAPASDRSHPLTAPTLLLGLVQPAGPSFPG